MDCVGCFKCRLWGKLQVSFVSSWGGVWKHLIWWDSGAQMRFLGTSQLLDRARGCWSRFPVQSVGSGVLIPACQAWQKLLLQLKTGLSCYGCSPGEEWGTQSKRGRGCCKTGGSARSALAFTCGQSETGSLCWEALLSQRR